MRKQEIMGLATAVADLASKSDASTDEVVDVLQEQLRKLPVNAPEGAVVANPEVTAKKQDQKRKQPKAHGEPTTQASKDKDAWRWAKKVQTQKRKAKTNAAIGD
jgi:hypothetical protein